MPKCECNACKIEDALNQELSLLKGVKKNDKLIALARMSGELLAEFGDDIDQVAQEYISIMQDASRKQPEYGRGPAMDAVTNMELENAIATFPERVQDFLRNLAAASDEVHIIRPSTKH